MATHSERILVTGATGSLGKQLLYELTRDGYDPVALVRKESNTAYVDSLKIEKRFADLRDRDAIAAVMAGIDMVIHTAAWVNFRQDRMTQFTGVNTFGAVNLYEAAHRAGVKRFVQVSTIAAVGAVPIVRGHPSTPIDEQFAFNLRHLQIPYILSKHAAEEELLRLSTHSGAPELIIVNPSIIVAPSRTGDDRTKATKLLSRRFLPKLATQINVVDLRDVAPAIRAALWKGHHGRRYILGGDNITVQQLITQACAILNVRTPRLITIPRMLLAASANMSVFLRTLTGGGKLSFYPDLVRLVDYDWIYTSERAKHELGFDPRPFKATLTDLLTNNLVGTHLHPTIP